MTEDIAIIGMSCRFPDADDPHRFWDNLQKGKHSIREIPPERWDINKYYTPDISEYNKSISKWCGLVNHVDHFDHRFFQISPREARYMDPQQRLLLEETWHCIENSGVPLTKLQATKTAVHVGVMTGDYRDEITNFDYELDGYTGIGTLEGILANRISYMFGLSGESSIENGACASSLLAVHEGKAALQRKECDYAIASGVNLYLHPWRFVSFSKARMLSPDGQCKTFDKDANGYVPGEGLGVVLLQRLEDAIRDGNHIYAVVKGSAVNHGGRAVSLTAPRIEAQKDVILSAYDDADISPETVTYWEAHGTGTTLGDPIEVEAATRAVREYTDKTGFCHIGSVKTNVGHLEAAAGMAGLFKVIMMMQYGKIPQTLNIQTLNPMIDFPRTPFVVADQLYEWKSHKNNPYRASISSFGFGGVNSHLILEQFRPKQSKKYRIRNDRNNDLQLFTLSAKNEESLSRMITNWRMFAESSIFKEARVDDICKTLLNGREQYNVRVAQWIYHKKDLTTFLEDARHHIHVNDNKQMSLYVGNLHIDGFESIQAWKPELDNVRKYLYELGKGKLWKRFTRKKWKKTDQPLFSTLVGYVMFSTLKRLGFSPKTVTGEGNGVYLSLIISGIISIDTFIKYMSDKRGKQTLSVRRPNIPFDDPVTSRTIMPYRFTPDYIEKVRQESELNEIPDSILKEYIDKAKLIETSQYTFKSMLKDWNKVLAPYHYDVLELLQSETSDPKKQWLLLLVISCSLNQLKKKWDLPSENPWNHIRFQEWMTLIEEDILSKELVVELLVSQTPDYEGIAKSLESHQNQLEHIDRMPLLKEINQQLSEINHIDHWLETLQQNDRNDRILNDSTTYILLGEVKNLNDLHDMMICDTQNALEETWQQALKTLWLHGVDMKWEELYPEGSYHKVRLPGYSFNRKQLRLLPSNKRIEEDVEASELIHTEPIKRDPSKDDDQTIKTLEDEGEHQMNTLYEQTEAYLKSVLAAELEVSVEDIESDIRFEEYGIDSILIHHFNQRMEQDIGSLPKTILFECENVGELTTYMVDNHEKELIDLLASDPTKVHSEGIEPSNATSTPKTLDVGEPVSVPNDVSEDDIAIIGLSGRYPQARHLDEFWEVLREGKDTVREIPSERWDWMSYYDPDPHKADKGKSYSKWGAFIEDVDKFDPLFFNISPIEAETMDPQERLFIETAWATLEDAGYTPDQLRSLCRGELNADVGVFVGTTTNSYLLRGPEAWAQQEDMVIPTSLPWSIANRVSYLFNLKGPSIPVDTACSASLAAVHLACESIKNGECSKALVGGVNLYLHPSKYVWLSQLRMLSPTGRCHSFGAQGDGFVPGEGVGAMLLKPLADAINDGDHIYGVIKGTSINHDGRTNGYTVPNPHAQTELIHDALERSNIDPQTISYIEAHGTGTSLGDPIEVAGLTKAFAKYTDQKQYCALGSLKSNIGHLESAAGIAGITKILLQMKYKQLVPSLHAKELNPNITFEDTPFYVQRELKEWEQPVMTNGEAVPRRAGISSFGAGGANAHVVLEEYVPAVKGKITSTDEGEGEHVVVLSAQTEDQLRLYARHLGQYLTKHHIALKDVAYTLQVGRVPMEERLVIVTRNLSDLQTKLGTYADGETEIQGVYLGTARISKQKPKQQTPLHEFLQGRDIKQYAHEVVSLRKLHPLAQFWVLGGQVEWEELYTDLDGSPQRISLPTYPFARERYWIPEVGQTSNDSRPKEIEPPLLHPLVGRNISTIDEYKFKTVIRGDEFFIADHYVGTSRVLPGLVLSEMVRTAGELLGGNRKVRKVRNIVLISPIYVKDTSVSLYIHLKPEGELLQFEVYSKDRGKKILHGQGKIEFESTHQSTQSSTEWRDIEAIKSRCTKEYKTKADSYQHLHSIELNLRRSFQAIEEIYIGETEAIAPIQLPDHLADDFDEYTLHPALMDGALQIPPAGEMRGIEEMIHLPYTFEEIEVFHPLPKHCYSYCRLALTKKGTKPKVPKFDVDIMDDKGKVLVKVKGFLARPIDPSDFIDRDDVSSPHHDSVKQVMDMATFKPVWQKETLTQSLSHPNGPIVLFDTGDQLFKHWNVKVPVVLVQPGKSFAKLNDRSFKINVTNEKDYHSLIEELSRLNVLPKHIVYLWGDRGLPHTEAEICQRLDKSIYALLYLSQALVKQKIKDPVQLLYMYNVDGLSVEPLQGAIGGAARTLHLESSKLRYQNIAVDEETSILSVLNNEIRAESEAGIDVRYRQGKRWVRRYQMFNIDQHMILDYTWRTDGVYLITGGLGGLGLMFAEHIAKQASSATLVLTGRSPLEGERQVNLQALRHKGIDVHYIQANISEQTDVDTLVRKIKKEFGQVNGVLHSAGVIRDSFFIRKQADEMKEVLAPKVFGTLLLDEALSNEPLDFFVMFSSSSAVLGNLGQFDYAYANHFMDLFAEWRERQRDLRNRSGKSLAINWPLWRSGGMQVNDHSEEYLFQQFGMKPLSAETGLGYFEKGLVYEGSQFMLIEGNPNKTNEILGMHTHPSEDIAEQQLSHDIQEFQPLGVKSTQTVEMPMDAKQTSKGETSMDAEHTSEDVSHTWIEYLIKDLTQMISDLLKIPMKRIREDNDLSDYGFDSIKFTDFSNAINRQFDLDITPAIFFEYSTIESFADYLVEDYSEQLEPRFASQMIDEKEDRKDVNVSSVTSYTNYKSTDMGFDTNIHINKEMNHTTPQTDTHTKEPIAIVGMGGVLPQSDHLGEFWKNLIEGENCITEIPSDRWDWREYLGDPSKSSNKTNSKWGGFIRDVDKFDAKFFGISPREAELMDPQQRILLETVWNTIEDAGYKASDLARIKTGLYVGSSTNDYMELLEKNNVDIQAYTTTGNFHSILVNRISYLLNFSGPSFPIDTACSSSLVAVRQAVEGLWNRSCDAAVVAGVNLLLTPTIYISFSKAGMLSPDGRCKTFDKDANGYVRAEGAGAVLLKPLSQAIEDKDHIYAVIKGTSVNHGGKVNTLTTPNPNAQAKLIMDAFEESHIAPSTVTYMETHGTGTSLGDPIEINGLKKAFKELAKRRGSALPNQPYCGIGSVKTNIGHLEPAAGISGLLKVLLAMKHKMLPASINLSEQNPYVQLDGSPFYIVKEATPWKTLRDEHNRSIPRRAGVSSFGFGGVNAHVVLEEYEQPDVSQLENEPTEPQLFVLSAKSRDRLKVYARKWIDFITSEGESVSHSLDDHVDIERHLIDLAADVINVHREDIYTDIPFVDIGFDLINLTTLLDRINQHYDLELTNNIFTQFPTIEELAFELANLLGDQSKKSVTPFSLRDMAYTLQVGREEMDERLAFVFSTREELRELLTDYVNDKEESGNMFTGNVSTNIQNQFDLLLEGREGKQFIQTIFEGRKWNKIAQLWVSGVSIDWKLLYSGQQPHRTPLPTYPFSRDRHWFKQPIVHEKKIEQKAGTQRVETIDHPFINEYVLNHEDKLIRDHMVDGQPMLPGVGYLDIAYQAVAKQLGPHVPFTLERVVWLQPLVVTDHRTIQTVISPEEQGRYKFEIQSLVDQEEVTHATGYISKDVNKTFQLEQVQWENIIQSSTSHYIQQNVYRMFQNLGLTYGPYFRGIQELWVSEHEAVARLQLPTEYMDELDIKKLHPTLMDSALQTIAGLSLKSNRTSRQTILPYAIDRIEWVRPLQAQSYVYVKALKSGRFSVYMTDVHGHVCVRMEEVTIRTSKSTDRLKNFFYKPTWIEQSLTSDQQETVEIKSNSNILIVAPKETWDVGHAIVEQHLKSNLYTIDPNEVGNWENTLASIPLPDYIYFLGGLQDPHVNMRGKKSLELLEARQTQGVMGLFHLVKAMSQLGWMQHKVVLKVITNDVHTVVSDEHTQPLSASLIGLTMSVAKEYPNLQISCVDITLTESITLQISAIITEPPHPNGEGVAIRHGKRYVRMLQPTNVPSYRTTRFRQQGVYMIVGGAGGIGLTLSSYLAAKVNARLILIGRSELNDEQKQHLKEIEASGGEVMYVRADVTKLDEMLHVKAEAVKRFGHIHGVIHAAIVLHDRSLEWMEKDTFRKVLRPKVEGSVILHETFCGDELDFMTFFSSAQSFTGSPGQSNYAAASTFMDAYAQSIDFHEDYPVHIINWGFWGDVGVVADEKYRDKLAEQGIYSIHPTEGMEAIERMLAHTPQQLLAIHADESVIQEMNGGVSTPVTTEDSSREKIDGYTNLHEYIPFLPKKPDSIRAFKELSKISQLLLLNYFRTFNIFVRSGEWYDFEQLRHRLSITDEYKRLFRALLSLLADRGFITIDGPFIRSTQQVEENIVQDALNNLEERLQLVLHKYPEVSPHIRLLNACMNNFSDIVQGHILPTDIVFPNSSLELVEHIYKGSYYADYCNEVAAKSVKAYIKEKLPELAPGEKLNIIEVGAGTGGTSTCIFDNIKDYHSMVNYVYTDISVGFTNYGKRNYGKTHHFIQFKPFDVNENIETQGFSKHDYDIVIAANVLHATNNIHQSLKNVRDLLKPQGWLLLNEVTEVEEFHTLTFGLLKGWWLFEDKDVRIQHSPLLTPSMWEQALRDTGFTHIANLSHYRHSSESLPQNVMIAMSADGKSEVPRKLDMREITEIPVDQTAVGGRQSTKQYIEKIILEQLAESLGIVIEDIDLTKEFSTYGVDSIVAVELINQLNESFGIALRTIIVFDYPNIKTLTDYIYENFTDELTLADNQRSSITTQVTSNDHTYADTHHQTAQQISVSTMERSKRQHVPEDANVSQDMYEYIEQTIIKELANSLGMNPEEIHLMQDFSSYGVDSIVGVEFINKLNDDFQIPLRTIVIFDYSNVKELARYIYAEYGDQIINDLPLETAHSDVKEDNDDDLMTLLDKLESGELDLEEVNKRIGG